MKLKEYLNFTLETDFPIAYDSPDHIEPYGTARDNSVNYRFNEKLFKLFGNYERPLKILDLGCSGGGFVKSVLDVGCIAIGLEGSTYSKILNRAEWGSIPKNLFTCDITKPFKLSMDNGGSVSKIEFDVVTCWEVMEHLTEQGIEGLIDNVKNHLSSRGLWIMSISPNEDVVNGIVLHQTVKPKDWWIEKFKTLGLYHIPAFDHFFNGQYVRGKKYFAPNSFHLILTTNIKTAPNVPKRTGKIYDYWLGTTVQRVIQKWITGR